MLSKEILLLYDNAQPHTASRTQDLIASFGWEQLQHLPYSPDLAPSDYHLFLNLTKHFGGQHHDDNNSFKTTVNRFEAIVVRYDECLNNGVIYLEKLVKI